MSPVGQVHIWKFEGNIGVQPGIDVEIGNVKPKVHQADQAQDRVENQQTNQDGGRPNRSNKHPFAKLNDGVWHRENP